MDRRQALFGAAALAASTVAQAFPEKEYCINPWQQDKTHDALVKPSDILLVNFISLFADPDPKEDYSWLEVWTKDGRFLTTEFACLQDDVYQLRGALTQGMEARQKDYWSTLYKPVGVELNNLLERWRIYIAVIPHLSKLEPDELIEYVELCDVVGASKDPDWPDENLEEMMRQLTFAFFNTPYSRWLANSDNWEDI